MGNTSCDIGMAFPGAAGENLRLGMISSGLSVCSLSISDSSQHPAVMPTREDMSSINFSEANDVSEFVKRIRKPRIIFAGGKPFAESFKLLADIAAGLENGDMIIDCSCSSVAEGQKRFKSSELFPCIYASAAFSKDPREARKQGVSAFFGGSKSAWDACSDIFFRLKGAGIFTECGRIGDGASAIFAKNLCSAIEITESQLTCEAYDLLIGACGLKMQDAAEIFEAWGEKFDSSMLSAAAKILHFKDASGISLAEKIRDIPMQKNDGMFALLEAVYENMPFDTLSSSFFSAGASSLKGRRERLSKAYTPENSGRQICRIPDEDDVKHALMAARAIALSQCISVLRSSSAHHAWGVNCAQCADLWNASMPIKSALLESIAKAYAENSDLETPLFEEGIKNDSLCNIASLRRAVAYSVSWGIPLPCMSAALSAFDSARRNPSSANLLAALSEIFNHTGFERNDAPKGEIFHSSFEQPERNTHR